MRELVYIHAGTSHLASHFFNIQQSYFAEGRDDQVPLDHDVSFREGRAPDVRPAACAMVYFIFVTFPFLPGLNDLLSTPPTL